jgi:hypothetical protein
MTFIQLKEMTQAIPAWLEKMLLAGLFCVFTAAFIVIKLSTSTYDQAQYFRDTASYARMADVPVASAYFWVGERPFTLPLFFKLIGVNSQNYRAPVVMAIVGGWQIWLSIVCWTLLGLALAWSTRRRFTALLIFGMCLAFSSIYEISKWDMLLLSESISFSLFALLLVGWIWQLSLLTRPASRLARIASLAGSVFITILYTFVRDSNIYFAVIAATVFAGTVLLYKKLRTMRWYVLAYLACALALLLAQNVSINLGNRWQIFIYDHLAYRIIPNTRALAYFVQAGLPVSKQLLKIPEMRGAVYQDLMLHSPEMAAVRQWTDAHGKATYFGYLMSQPVETLMLPLRNAKELLDGTGMDYRVPGYTGAVVPRPLRGLARLMFFHLPIWAYVVAWLGLLTACVWGFIIDQQRTSWLVAAVLLVSMYPLMFLVWHGNPMEIPRHADQIAVQFRLAGWMVLAFDLDWIIYRKTSKEATSNALPGPA